MRNFRNFLKEDLNKFLDDYGLNDEWKAYQNQPKPVIGPPDESKGWHADTSEVMRELNYVMKKTIDGIRRTNEFGIQDISFDITNQEQMRSGVQLTLEVEGTATAKNLEHVKKLLYNLLNQTSPILKKKNIYLYILYNHLQTVMEEDSPIGLIRKIKFRTMGAAVWRG